MQIWSRCSLGRQNGPTGWQPHISDTKKHVNLMYLILQDASITLTSLCSPQSKMLSNEKLFGSSVLDSCPPSVAKRTRTHPK